MALKDSLKKKFARSTFRQRPFITLTKRIGEKRKLMQNSHTKLIQIYRLYSEAVPVNLEESISEEPSVHFIEGDQDFFKWKKITDNTSRIGTPTTLLSGQLNCSPIGIPHNSIIKTDKTSSSPESATFDSAGLNRE